MPSTIQQLAIVTVTYHPDLELLTRQLSRLPAEARLVIVDNASEEVLLNAVQQLCESRPNTTLLRNNSNAGLAAAINRGAAYITQQLPEIAYLLLLDQDSVPETGAIEDLLEAFTSLRNQNPSVACVGPRLVDASTGLQHGFHRIHNLCWTRQFPSENDPTPVSCTNLNGSGTLTSLALFNSLKGLDERLFIDHVDTEWSFRVLSHGLKLYGIPWAAFEHSMGERGLRFWMFGWRVWPQRSPFRHYYLFRNALWLMRRRYVPITWKFWAAVKLTVTTLLHGVFDPGRYSQFRCMLKGLRDGVRTPH